MADQLPEELDSILKEIENAIAAKLYYLAIAVTLSIPDICSGLEFDPDKPGWQDRKTYARWCKDNLDLKFNTLTGEDLYNIRGGVLHKGNFDHQKSRFDRVIFVGPNPQVRYAKDIIVTIENAVFSGKNVKDINLHGELLHVDLMTFCQYVMDAAREWYAKNKENPFVQKNMQNLVRYRPNGLPPYIVNVPLIA